MRASSHASIAHHQVPPHTAGRGWCALDVTRGLAAALLAILIGGCAAWPRGPVDSGQDSLDACAALFERMDQEVIAAGVGDAAYARIEGFRWLRANRLLASFRDEVDDEERFRTWVDRLARLDEKARHAETANLPSPRRAALSEAWREAAALHALPAEPLEAQGTCRERLNARLMTDTADRERLREAMRVPAAYTTWLRVLGLYPITSRIARNRVEALHRRLAEPFQEGLPAGASIHRYHSAGAPTVAPVKATVRRDALGFPLLDASQTESLLTAHAPIWVVQTESEADRPGAITLDGEGRPIVDRERPTEYREISYTRFEGQVLLQLNYLVWFPERPRRGIIDIYAGHLDAVKWRVTLLEDGRVLAYDSIHACGCYYHLFPASGWRVAPQPKGEEPVFAPVPAPRPAPGEHVAVGLAAGTHYLIGLGTAPAQGAQRLTPRPMSALRSLEHPAGGRASLYRSDGIVPHTSRPERLVFWPLGVPSAGAMRQSGRHAIAFIGRRHFDDPDLLERLLENETPG